jgi:hypothetical protein
LEEMEEKLCVKVLRTLREMMAIDSECGEKVIAAWSSFSIFLIDMCTVKFCYNTGLGITHLGEVNPLSKNSVQLCIQKWMNTMRNWWNSLIICLCGPLNVFQRDVIPLTLEVGTYACAANEAKKGNLTCS